MRELIERKMAEAEEEWEMPDFKDEEKYGKSPKKYPQGPEGVWGRMLKHGIKWTEDGWVCKNGLWLNGLGLTKLPKIKSVNGYFSCGDNDLTSLEGCPEKVTRGEFDCGNNKLTSLKGGPKSVGREYHCGHNKLTSLEGAPKKIKRDFDCSYNNLTSLKGAPREVGDGFKCHHNKLTSLKGGPVKVDGEYQCYNNNLTNLDGAPKEIGGGFNVYNNKVDFSEEDIKKVFKAKYVRVTPRDGGF